MFSYCLASRTWYAFMFLVSVSAEGTQVLLPELCLICASRCEFPFFFSEREFVALVQLLLVLLVTAPKIRDPLIRFELPTCRALTNHQHTRVDQLTTLTTTLQYTYSITLCCKNSWRHLCCCLMPCAAHPYLRVVLSLLSAAESARSRARSGI